MLRFFSAIFVFKPKNGTLKSATFHIRKRCAQCRKKLKSRKKRTKKENN